MDKDRIAGVAKKIKGASLDMQPYAVLSPSSWAWALNSHSPDEASILSALVAVLD